MDLNSYVERLRTEFVAISAVADEDVQETARRLVIPLSSAVRLVLMEALAAAATEISLELAPVSVQLSLNESSPSFVVMRPVIEPPITASRPDPAPGLSSSTVEKDNGAVARINFRPPETLKTRIEEAANRSGLSVNAWLIHATTNALNQPSPYKPSEERGRSGRKGWYQ